MAVLASRNWWGRNLKVCSFAHNGARVYGGATNPRLQLLFQPKAVVGLVIS